MITSINEFKKFLLNEDTAQQQQIVTTTLNSDKNTDLTGYENDLGYYNTNKNKLLALSQKTPDLKQEEDANKIINGNIYLGIAWKMYKLENGIKTDELKIGTATITAEEKSQIQQNIITNKQELSKIKKELDDKIKKDLGDIKKM